MAVGTLRRLGIVDLPLELQSLLRFGRGVDTAAPAVDIAGARIVHPARMLAVPMNAVRQRHVEADEDDRVRPELERHPNRVKAAV